MPSPADQGKRPKEERHYGLVIALYGLLVLLLIGIPYYFRLVAPWRHVVLQVGEVKVTTRELFERLRPQRPASGFGSLEMITRFIQGMEKEALLREAAKERNLTVSEEEIDKEIRRRVSAASPGEGKFEDLYAAFLRKTGLSEKAYREQIRTEMIREKLLLSFARQIPPETEQLHLAAIILGTPEKTDTVRKRLQKGEDFFRLARETSVDLESARKGGEMGWFPKGVEELSTPGQMRVQGILTKSEEDAKKILDRLKADQDWGKLAKTYSHDRKSREEGGDLGWISADPTEGMPFGPELYPLQPGGISRPLPTADGFWILKVVEKTPKGKVVDDIAFHLPVGAVSPPLNTDRGVMIIKVLAKERRPLTAEQKAVLAEKTLSDWLEGKAEKGRKEGRIRWDWGSETYDWLVRHWK